MPAPILFDISLNDLEDGRAHTLARCAGDAKLGGLADIAEGCTAMQRDLNRLLKWAERNLVQFKERKDKVLHLRRNISRHRGSLGATQLVSTLSRKELKVLVDKSLSMTQECALGTKVANGVPGAPGGVLPAGGGR